MAEVWNVEMLREKIENLKEKGKTSEEQYIMYVLNPYVASLGYDVFNIDEVDMDIASGRLRVHATESVDLIVSTSNYLPSASNEEDKIFLCIDMRNKEMSLYLNALGSWEQVGGHDLNQEDNSGEYPKMMRLVSKESLRRTLHEKGDRLFTEGVLRQQLDDGKYDNRFVRDVIQDMIEKPSEGFIRLLADGLADKYSTETVQKLMGGLNEFKTVGLESILGELLGGVTTIKNEQKSTVKSVESNEEPVVKKQVVEEPAEELLEKAPEVERPKIPYVKPAYPSDQLFEDKSEEDVGVNLETSSTFFGSDWNETTDLPRVNTAPIRRVKTEATEPSNEKPDLLGLMNKK